MIILIVYKNPMRDNWVRRALSKAYL